MNLTPYDSQDLLDFWIAGKSWKEWKENHEQVGLTGRENLWVSENDLKALQSAGGAASLQLNGECVATMGSGDGCSGVEIEASAETFLISHIWDLLRVTEQVVGGLRRSQLNGQVHEGAFIEGEVVLGEGTRLLPGVYIEGNAVIGKNCKIGPNCYIRGNTSIGDGCHIGNAVEIKNSLLGHGTNVGHLSYVGDSILGHKVNLGSGTTVSNLRHDGKNHRSVIEGKLIDTGRRKFGAIIADGVHTGINTSIYPARKLGKSVTTLPGEVINVDRYI